MSCSHVVMQSCGRKTISLIGPHDTQTARPQDKTLHFHYLIPVIPKTWQETWQDFLYKLIINFGLDKKIQKKGAKSKR